MIWNISNYCKLNNIFVKTGDTIEFNEEIIYIVHSRWIGCLSNPHELVIFEKLQELNLIQCSIVDFCTQQYGYTAKSISSRACPECKDNDMKALSNLIFAIFELLYNQTFIKLKLTPVKTSFLL